MNRQLSTSSRRQPSLRTNLVFGVYSLIDVSSLWRCFTLTCLDNIATTDPFQAEAIRAVSLHLLCENVFGSIHAVPCSRVVVILVFCFAGMSLFSRLTSYLPRQPIKLLACSRKELNVWSWSVLSSTYNCYSILHCHQSHQRRIVSRTPCPPSQCQWVEQRCSRMARRRRQCLYLSSEFLMSHPSVRQGC